MKNLDAALHYADLGFGVLPIKGKYGTDDKDSKRPLIKGWEEKKQSHETIKQWYKEWPMANVGISTGPVSKLLVLDIDGLKGMETMKGKDTPVTPIVKTKRGFHHYYQWDDRLNGIPTTRVGFLPGLDSRGWGGYVVAPPSIYFGGEKYSWTDKSNKLFSFAKPPEWFVQLLLISKVQVSTEDIKSFAEDPWLIRLWQGVPTGENRHNALVRLSSYFIGKRMPADFTYEIMKEWNEKNDPPLSEEKFDLDFKDVLQRFKDGRYRPLETRPTEQTIIETADQYLKFIEDRGSKPAIELTYGLPTLDKLTGGIERGNIEVYGALTKGGKTMFMLNILHHNIRNGKKVVYFPTEMTNNEILSRYFSIAEGLPHNELKTGQLSPETKAALAIAVRAYKASGFHIIRNYQPSLEDIHEAYKKFKPDILAIDYLQHCSISSAGSKSAGMETFVKGLGELASSTGISIIATAQPSKAKRDYKDGYKIVPMTIHDFADSSIIEKEASKILIIHPGATTAFDRVRPIRIDVVNRHGDSGEVSIAFDKDKFKFFD